MKQFFEQYGGVALGILALLVLIAMITPVGNIIKTSLQGTAHKFSSSINSQTDTMTSDMEKMLENSMYVSEYAKEVLSKQRLYDAGEQNLTADDIVTINGVECYVLEATATTAKLITKEIYAGNFDNGGHTYEETQGRVGVNSGYTDATYDYKYATIRELFNDFYENELGSDSKILKTNVTYYVNDNTAQIPEFNSYISYSDIQDYVFALDAKEALQYKDKFVWNSGSKNKNNFWISAGFVRKFDQNPIAWHLNNTGNISVYFVNGLYEGNYYSYPVGIRPVFWISLE